MFVCVNYQVCRLLARMQKASSTAYAKYISGIFQKASFSQAIGLADICGGKDNSASCLFASNPAILEQV